MDLVQAALSGQHRAVARLMSIVESGTDEEAHQVLAQLYRHTGRARIIGVTGAPGSGKSTLIGRLAMEYRHRGRTVGILAVDPTSPLSGGAILGDRVRMRALSGDAGVFIRSMANRGVLGGLAKATGRVVQILDACGYERILVETVGAGQADSEVSSLAHSTIVLQVPGMGDEIQMLKAGILEIGDLLVVNKADQEGADRLVVALQEMIASSVRAAPGEGLRWVPPVLQTVSTTGEGVPQVVDALERHVAYLAQSSVLAQREGARLRKEFEALLRDELWRSLVARAGQDYWHRMLARIGNREIDPYQAAREVLRDLGLTD